MTSPGTRKRSIRIPDPLWHEFLVATTTAGANASEVVRGLIQEWLDTQQGEK